MSNKLYGCENKINNITKKLKTSNKTSRQNLGTAESSLPYTAILLTALRMAQPLYLRARAPSTAGIIRARYAYGNYVDL
jgi:hypothetical protein